MSTLEFIIALFCQVDSHLQDVRKRPHATLWPSEVVTLGLLHALKGVGNRAFYRWLTRDYRILFPHVPERRRLLSLLHDPSALDAALLGFSNALRGHRHVWHRADPSDL
jgi:hypothetical protein